MVKQEYFELMFKFLHLLLCQDQFNLGVLRAYPFLNCPIHFSLTDENSINEMEYHVKSLLERFNASDAAQSFGNHYHPVRMPISVTTLPHVLNNPKSLVPQYLTKSMRNNIDYVVGIPTVNNHNNAFLYSTLTDTIRGLSPKVYNKTLIIVEIGGADLNFTRKTAKMIKNQFPKQIKDGLIEIIAPSPSYYPNALATPYGPPPRALNSEWNSMQNLDVAYLMSHAECRGKYFMLLEDDVMVNNNYMETIDSFVKENNYVNPNWVMINYGNTGVTGKLFKRSEVSKFVAYTLLFYENQPIDWLLESYISGKACRQDIDIDQCIMNKEEVRPQYLNKIKLFKRIDSSQKEEPENILDKGSVVVVPEFVSNKHNPPVARLVSNIANKKDHSLKVAYDGNTYYWGDFGRVNEAMEFYFKQPTWIGEFCIRTGNYRRPRDIIQHAVVEVLRQNSFEYEKAAEFDKFGIADGNLEKFSYIDVIRVRLLRNTKSFILISEMRFDLMLNVTETPESIRGFKHPLIRNL